jgi:hypothetical protein
MTDDTGVSRDAAGSGAPASPFWIRALDWITIALVCGAVWVALSGGIRMPLGVIRVSLTSPVRLAVLAVAIAGVRHLIRRQPSLVRELRRVRPRRLSNIWAATGPIWAVSRSSVILAGYFAVLLIGFAEQPTFRISENVFLNLPARWDAGWYLDIAVNGYRWRGGAYKQQNVAFFPAFPIAMRVAGVLVGAERPGTLPTVTFRRMLLAGWVVAILMFWYALVYVYRWSDARAGPAVAKATVTLLAVYPFAVFFSAPYTEALFLLGATAAFVHFERGEWARAAIWGVLLGLVRPNGVLLSIPLAMLALKPDTRSQLWSPRGLGVWTAIGAPAVGLLLYSLFMYQLTGDLFAWSQVQAAWGRTYQLTTWIGLELTEVAKHGAFVYTESAPVTVLNGMAALMALALLWPIGRFAGLPYVIFVVVNLAPAIVSGGLMSVGRFTSTLFPLFFALAALVPERQLTGWVVAFSVLQGLLAVLFFTWRPPF